MENKDESREENHQNKRDKWKKIYNQWLVHTCKKMIKIDNTRKKEGNTTIFIHIT